MMDWVMAKLYPHAFHKEFFVNDELSDPEHLKQQFHKNRKRWEILYPYRRRHVARRDPFLDTLLDLDNRGIILTFGKTQVEFGAIFKDSGGFLYATYEKFIASGSVEKLATRIFHDKPKFKHGVIFPDLSFFVE